MLTGNCYWFQFRIMCSWYIISSTNLCFEGLQKQRIRPIKTTSVTQTIKTMAKSMCAKLSKFQQPPARNRTQKLYSFVIECLIYVVKSCAIEGLWKNIFHVELLPKVFNGSSVYDPWQAGPHGVYIWTRYWVSRHATFCTCAPPLPCYLGSHLLPFRQKGKISSGAGP